jgi:uncharacterized membrane protein YidH (DUF202 family)
MNAARHRPAAAPIRDSLVGLVLVLVTIIIAAVGSLASLQLDERDERETRRASAPGNRPSVAAGHR